MSWNRSSAATAMAAQITAALGGDDSNVFATPPATLNAPAVVVGRLESVLYDREAIGADVATVPVICLHAFERDDDLDALKLEVRAALEGDRRLGGAVLDLTVTEERNWRNLSIAGADLLAVDLITVIRS